MLVPHWLLYLLFIGTAAILFGFTRVSEGFRAGEAGVRCGVDLPTCGTGTQCFNGFCGNPVKPGLPRNELPVYP